MKTAAPVEAQKVSRKRIDRVTTRRLGQTEVSDYYELVADAVLAGLSGAVDGKDPSALAARIMAALMNGNLACWALLANNEQYVGAITTRIVEEPIIKVRSLLIYSVYSAQYISIEGWKDVYRTLCGFARRQRCDQGITYSDNPRAIEICDALGARADRREIVFSLGEEV